MEVWHFRRDLYVAFWRSSSEDAGMPRRNARIDAFVLDALGFDGPRSNPRPRAPRAPRPRAPYHPKADPWAAQRAVIAEHLMHAAAARQRARYDADALEVAEYHEAEAARLEDELEASRRPHGPTRRQNPVADRAVFIQQDAGDDEEHDFFGQAHALFNSQGIRLHSNYDRFFVIFDDADDERVVATAAMCLYDDEPPSIEFSVAVAPDQQRKGLAKKLVEEVIRYTQQSSTEFGWGDDTEVEAYVVNEEAMIPLLTRLGFEQSDADPKRWRRRAFARANPRAAVDVDSAWVGVHDCEHHGLPSPSSPPPRRPNPATKRGEGRYTDSVELEAFVNDTIARFDERPDAGPPTLLPKPPGLPRVQVVFTRGGRTNAGTCVYNRVTKDCVIRLNGLLWDAMTEEDRFDTVMHEAAHAIEFQRYGTSSHGPRWQFIAKAIGCSAEACVTGEAAQRMRVAYREKMGLPAQGVRPREAWTPGDVFVHQKTPRSKKTIGRITHVGEHPDYASFKGILVAAQGSTPLSGVAPYASMSLPTDADRDMLEQAEAASERARLAMFARGRQGVDKPAPGESLAAWLERTGRR